MLRNDVIKTTLRNDVNKMTIKTTPSYESDVMKTMLINDAIETTLRSDVIKTTQRDENDAKKRRIKTTHNVILSIMDLIVTLGINDN